MLFPVGIDNFRTLIDDELDFIDKTLFIKEILDDRATHVAVITRPRRFGKTLNLSMLHYFLAAEISGRSTAGLFDDLKIAQCGNDYMKHQGKYPVIFITLKEIKHNTFNHAYHKLIELIVNLCNQFYYLSESDKLTKTHKRNFEILLSGEANQAQLENALYVLSECLYYHHGVKPWILIDEYDTPIQAAYINNLDPEEAKDLLLPKEDETRINYYRNMTSFMRSFLGTALKSNPYLHRAVITGILRVAKESLFSDLNNLRTYSILSARYSEYFGFTEPEVEAILQQANLADKADEIKEWYNGYQVGPTVVYNPWSIANCIDEKGFLQTYWVNSGENQLIKELLKKSSISFKERFEHLIQGKNITCLINENMVFQYLDANPKAVWNLLLMSGYLKPLSSEIIRQGTQCELAIPNREVNDLYVQIIEEWLSNGLDLEWFNEFINALVTGDMDTFKKGLENIILQITSYHDFAKQPEAFFHGLMLGFLARLHNNGYDVQSNKESGYGRYDIMLVPDDKTKLGIIIELKNSQSGPNVGAKNLSPKTPIPGSNNENHHLIKLAQEALQQIDEKKYPEALKQSGITNILKIGIGFCIKAFELVSSLES